MLNFSTREFPNLVRALGGWGKDKNFVAANFRSPSEGMAEGGCGGNSALPSQKIEASPATLLVKSRTQQKSFLFLLEEKIGRAQNKKCKENFFPGQRAKRAAAGRSVSFVQRNFAQSLEYPTNYYLLQCNK